MLLVRRPENQHILLIDNVSHIRQIESLVPLRFRGNGIVFIYYIPRVFRFP